MKRITSRVRMRRAILFAFSFFVTAFACLAADYYVSPQGTADNDGSFTRPWNLAKAFGHGGLDPGPKPGDTVWIRGGSYRGVYEVHSSGIPGRPVIYRGYPGERATLDGGSDDR